MGNVASADAASQPELPVAEDVAGDAAAPAAAADANQEQPSKESQGADETKEEQDGEDLVQVQEDQAVRDSAAVEQAAAAENESGDTQEEAAEEEEEQPKFKYTVEDVKTAPADPRFPTTNQTKHCYTRYNEFHKCEKERGEGAPDCQKYKRWFLSLCPMDWIDRWNEQREAGVFPGPY